MHDMIIWHAARELAGNASNPLEGGVLVATLDGGFIHFDRHKRRQGKSRYRILVHPVTLIQLLGLWAPQDEVFQQAVLASLRLPFLLTEFDAASERTTIRILNRLSRFTKIGDLSDETVMTLLKSEALRASYETNDQLTDDQEIELIESAITAELSVAQKDLALAHQESSRLEAELATRAEAEQGLEHRVTTLRSDIDGLRSELALAEKAWRMLRYSLVTGLLLIMGVFAAIALATLDLRSIHIEGMFQ